MNIIKWRFIISILLIVQSALAIYTYHQDHSIYVCCSLTVHGEQAIFYYYMFWALLAVGVFFLATSWRRE